jgi:hypothetical protein
MLPLPRPMGSIKIRWAFTLRRHDFARQRIGGFGHRLKGACRPDPSISHLTRPRSELQAPACRMATCT